MRPPVGRAVGDMFVGDELNVFFGAGYFHKVIVKKALSEAGLVRP